MQSLIHLHGGGIICGDTCDRRVFTSLMYSWSWVSVKTSVDDGFPILWAMVYNSSLYRGFNFEQK